MDAAPQRARLPAGPVLRLSGLFAVDAFAGGLAVQAILALYFEQRYGVTATQLGLLFFATNLVPALAQACAPRLAARRGLLTAMLAPHTAANMLLLCVPLAPTFGLAAALLLARHALSKIDVRARQAFTAAITTPDQRTAAASFTSVARSVAVSASPLTSSALLNGALLAVGAPLLVGAGLGLVYDVAMWRSFRGLPAASIRRAPRVGRHRLASGRPAPPAWQPYGANQAARHPSVSGGRHRAGPGPGPGALGRAGDAAGQTRSGSVAGGSTVDMGGSGRVSRSRLS